VFEGLWDVIGPDGTMIVPTYYLPGGTILNAAQEPDYVFDPAVHGSNLGALPSAFLTFPGVRRSLHPTHSVSAVGRHAEYITADHHGAPSVFGEGSPWQRFIELDGKLLGVGISLGPVTFYHRLEDEMGDSFPLPIKRPETYRMRCRDAIGVVHEVPVRAFEVEYMQRRIDNPSRKDLRDYFWREMVSAGLMHVGKVGAASCWWIRAQAFHERLRRLALEGSRSTRARRTWSEGVGHRCPRRIRRRDSATTDPRRQSSVGRLSRCFPGIEDQPAFLSVDRAVRCAREAWRLDPGHVAARKVNPPERGAGPASLQAVYQQ